MVYSFELCDSFLFPSGPQTNSSYLTNTKEMRKKRFLLQKRWKKNNTIIFAEISYISRERCHLFRKELLVFDAVEAGGVKCLIMSIPRGKTVTLRCHFARILCAAHVHFPIARCRYHKNRCSEKSFIDIKLDVLVCFVYTTVASTLQISQAKVLRDFKFFKIQVQLRLPEAKC